MTNFRAIVKELTDTGSLDLKQLLGRNEIIFDSIPIKRFFRGKCVLITGAAGSVGSALFTQILPLQPSEIILLDRSTELRNIQPGLDYRSVKVRKFITDICDRSEVQQIFRAVRPDIVFHAAALKHVPLLESMHEQAVQVNIIGTEILAQASIENGVEKFVFVSTDKAVNPAGFMGATKCFGEMMMMHFGGQTTEFVTARFGNVLGSSGSVVPIFLNQIRMGQPLTITHPDMTRYLMTAYEAGQLLLETATKAKHGQILIAHMGFPVRLTELVNRLSDLLGTTADIKLIGIRPGEKMNEELIGEREVHLPSHHPQIQLVQVNPANACDVKEFLKLFKNTIASGNQEPLKDILRCAVPEYKP